ncbi:hypothetical protein PAXINDRAFT_181779 [Paxillus involutus ATCC 200175]|uniref:F-box domain-containing protein n=1 Tax=Paxillus involutus ATCC 200175 TaxID=664439 RepID=A0A0C9ST45_PAXIN|nr:hypothetical protein PAXINDRAFT_181779 [Paxillus involutus ATCC 200175]
MHEALRITEIFDVICQFATRSTLANLARTCQAFKESSLDELWKDLDTLAPLAGLLPASLWGELGGKMILRRPPSLDDWRLMQKYSSRVAVIRKTIFYARAVDQLLLVAWYSPPSSCIFPKLKVILSGMVLDERTQILRWMMGPSLTRLELTIHVVNETTHPFVSSLGTLCPNLTTVSLQRGLTSETELMVESMSQAICQWYHLVHATFNVLDTSAYTHISQLKSLTTLNLRLSHGVPEHLQDVELGPTPFPALTDLTIAVDDTSALAAWLSDLRLSPVNLTCNVGDFPMPVYHLCSLIGAHFCTRSLQSIYLDDPGSHYGWATVRLDETYPLLAFTRLRSVALHELCAISVDDHALKEFAAALPLLEVLHLSRCIFSIPGEEGAMPTFRGLFQLVKICPLLRELSIVIDTTQSEWVDLHRPGDGVCNHVLSMLILGNSRIDDPKRVALILGAVFTVLEKVDIEDWEHVPLYLLEDKETSLLLWHQVNDYLSDFAIVREQERWRGRLMET